MGRITEPNLQETLTADFLDQGLDVYGEVTLDTGRIDLVAETRGGQRWGIEVKNRWELYDFSETPSHQAPEDTDCDPIRGSKLRDVAKQVKKYADTGQLDRIYIATQNPDPLRQQFRTTSSVISKPSNGDVLNTISIPDYPGFIQTGVLPPKAVNQLERYPDDRPLCDASRETTILDHGRPLIEGDREPIEMNAESEAAVAHACWSAFPIAVREGVVPNPGGSKPLRPDVVAFTGNPMSARVYQHGPEEQGHIIGIEAKEQATPSVIDELSAYIEPGALTQLYLAVPEGEKRRAVELVKGADSPVNKVGVLSVVDAKAEFSVVQPARTLELRVGGLYVGKNDSRIGLTGWGRAWNLKVRPCPVYHQGDNVVLPPEV